MGYGGSTKPGTGPGFVGCAAKAVAYSAASAALKVADGRIAVPVLARSGW